MKTQTQTLLQAIKAKTGWSEPKIAAETGISQPTINRLLHGQPGCQVDTYLAIEALAARLKLLPKRRSRLPAESNIPSEGSKP